MPLTGCLARKEIGKSRQRVGQGETYSRTDGAHQSENKYAIAEHFTFVNFLNAGTESSMSTTFGFALSITIGRYINLGNSYHNSIQHSSTPFL